MRASRLFSTRLIDREAALPSLHVLDEQTAHYLMHVLRRKPGDEVVVFDGSGGEYLGRIHSLQRKAADIELLKFRADNRASSQTIHVALAALRGDRMDFALQKCSELGASEITPLLSERSKFKIARNKLEKRMQHWQGVLRSACEQCGLNKVPQLHPPTKLDDWLPSLAQSSKRLLLHPDGELLSVDSLLEATSTNNWVVASGPEGGFNDEEYKGFKKAGFTPCKFGPRILRAETAPVALLSILQFTVGDLGQ